MKKLIVAIFVLFCQTLFLMAEYESTPDNQWVFRKIDSFAKGPRGVAMSADGKLGYVITAEGNVDKYVDTYFAGRMITFNNPSSFGIACTADGKKIWITAGKSLWESGEDGNIREIDTFSSRAVGVALSADGRLGYVITYEGNIDKYTDGKFAGRIGQYANGILHSIACSADGRKVLITVSGGLWGNKLYEGTDNGGFVEIDSFENRPTGVAMSADGTIAYVATSKGNVDRYVNGRFDEVITVLPWGSSWVSCTADGQKVWVASSQENHENNLYEGVVPKL